MDIESEEEDIYKVPKSIVSLSVMNKVCGMTFFFYPVHGHDHIQVEKVNSIIVLTGPIFKLSLATEEGSTAYV